MEVIIFTADWCAPCTEYVPECKKFLESIISSKQTKFSNIEEIQLNSNKGVAILYGIECIPTIIFRVRSPHCQTRTFEVPKSRILGTAEMTHVKENALVALNYYDSIYK